MKQSVEREHIVADRDRTPRKAVPREVTWVDIGLVILVALHLVSIAIMLLQREAIAEGIKLANPALTGQQVFYALTVTLIASVFFHTIFMLLYVWLAFKIRTGKRWARIMLTVVLAIATASSIVSFSQSPMFRLIIPAGDVLQLALIGLLWFPASSRAYFGASSLS